MPETTDLVLHKGEMTTDEPIWSKPYLRAYSCMERLRKDIEKMTELGMIRELHSPYSSPIVIVQKKDRNDRLCID